MSQSQIPPKKSAPPQPTPQQLQEIQLRLLKKRQDEYNQVRDEVMSEAKEREKGKPEQKPRQQPGQDSEKEDDQDEEQEEKKDEPAQPVTPRANPPPKAKAKKPTPIKTKGRKWR